MDEREMEARLEQAEARLAELGEAVEGLTQGLRREVRTQRLVVAASSGASRVVVEADDATATVRIEGVGGYIDLSGDRDSAGIDMRRGPSHDEAAVHLRADYPQGHALVAVARDGNVVGELHARPGPDGQVLGEIIRHESGGT
jgi:hypothetical protein